MAYTIIDDPAQYFQTVLYTGDGGSSRSVTVDFQPNFVWIKERNGTNDNTLFDSVRGATKRLRSNTHEVEDTQANQLKSFDSDGFTLGSLSAVNNNGQNYVSWNWKEDATAGFDLVGYSGTGSQPATVSHSLGVIPDVVLVKPRDDAQSWCMFHKDVGAANIIYLDVTSAAGGTPAWNSTSPTSSVFTVNDNQVNKSSTNYIAYCFKGIQGYSKFGTYTGNGDANGAFVYTGFRPAFVLFKRKNGSGNWQLLDDKRTGLNPENHTLYPNSTLADQDETDANLLSNGFRLTNTGTDGNGSGDTYVYLSFAHSPFVNSKGVPTNAR